MIREMGRVARGKQCSGLAALVSDMLVAGDSKSCFDGALSMMLMSSYKPCLCSSSREQWRISFTQILDWRMGLPGYLAGDRSSLLLVESR